MKFRIQFWFFGIKRNKFEEGCSRLVKQKIVFPHSEFCFTLFSFIKATPSASPIGFGLNIDFSSQQISGKRGQEVLSFKLGTDSDNEL